MEQVKSSVVRVIAFDGSSHAPALLRVVGAFCDIARKETLARLRLAKEQDDAMAA